MVRKLLRVLSEQRSDEKIGSHKRRDKITAVYTPLG